MGSEDKVYGRNPDDVTLIPALNMVTAVVVLTSALVTLSLSINLSKRTKVRCCSMGEK